MLNSFGNYVWHYISNDGKVEGVEENHRYIVCVENSTPVGSEWLMLMVYWYNEGAELRLREPDGTPHVHKIKNSGFYIVNDAGKDRYSSIYLIHGVRYWTEIKLPETNPEDILTVL